MSRKHPIDIQTKETPAKRLGFRKSPGSNESQGGGGLKLLPGAIGLINTLQLMVHSQCSSTCPERIWNSKVGQDELLSDCWLTPQNLLS